MPDCLPAAPVSAALSYLLVRDAIAAQIAQGRRVLTGRDVAGLCGIPESRATADIRHLLRLGLILSRQVLDRGRVRREFHLPDEDGGATVPAVPAADAVRVGPVSRPLRLDAGAGCQWLHGEATERNFCGQPRRDGSSYCADHHARCYVRPAVAVPREPPPWPTGGRK